MFSTLTDRRSCLGKDNLDNLMHISADGPPFADWNAKRVIKLWSKGKHAGLYKMHEHHKDLTLVRVLQLALKLSLTLWTLMGALMIISYS